jgi:hypothetical protein
MALAAVAALSLASAAVVAVAQPAPPAAPAAPVIRERQIIIQRGDGVPDRIQRGDRGDHRGPGRDRMYGMANPEARAERLRTQLQLTANQEGALKTYLAAMAPPAMPAAAPRPASDTPTPNAMGAVERADRMAEMAARMATETRKRADATRTFYAALTPSQRKVFDTMPGMGGGRMIQIRQMRGPGMPGMPPTPPMPGRPG